MCSKRPKLMALVAVLALAFASSGFTAPGPQRSPDAVGGEILVKFVPGTPGQTIADVHRTNGGQVRESIPGIDVQVVAVPAGRESERVAAYAHNPNVAFAEVNGFYQTTWTPNDPSVGQQWQYNNTGQTGGKIDADIDAYEAWGVTLGSSSIAIAILDTGIDQSHVDLAAKIVKNMNFTDSATVDDKYGHGTHVAGSAAATTNNGTGVAGTCPNCTLYNVKVLNDSGSGAWSWIANGITWAANNGAKVISMSLGGSVGSRTVQTAVDYAWSKGVVLTAAAGNNGSKQRSYPAYYSNVIAVAATDSKDLKASWSNYGQWVDVAAPGAAILSTAPDHANSIWGTGVSYGTISGTSMATPHVAGLAGLIWSTGLCAAGDNACVRGRIENKADSISGTGNYWSHGRINAYKSVTAP